MKRLVLAALLVATNAYAEISVVDDPTPTPSMHMAKIITKNVIMNHEPRYYTRWKCEQITSSVHYDSYGEIRVSGDHRRRPWCREVIEEGSIQVFAGYEVTFEYNGQIHSRRLLSDPGDYIEVR